jgi:hypothetical protein
MKNFNREKNFKDLSPEQAVLWLNSVFLFLAWSAILLLEIKVKAFLLYFKMIIFLTQYIFDCLNLTFHQS